MFKKKKIAMGVVTALLLTGMLGLTAGATEMADTTVRPTKFKIQKTLRMDKNVENYPDLEFTFEFTQLKSKAEIEDAIGETTKSNIADDEIKNLISDKEVTLAPVTISYDGTETATPNTVKNRDGIEKAVTDVIKDADLYKSEATSPLKATDFPEPGLYVYKVTEKDISFAEISSTETTNKKITSKDELECSDEVYIMVIPVGYGQESDGTYDYESDLQFIMTDAVILKVTTDGETGAKDVEKVAVPDFTNIYQRNDEEDENGKEYGLKIKKSVVGKYANKGEDFTFKITIHANATEKSEVTGYDATVYDLSTGTAVNNKTYTVEFERETEFTLGHNEELRFEKFPVGTTWQVSETTPAAYSVSATTTIGTTTKTYDTGNSFADETFTIVEGENRMDVVNTENEITVTGIVTDNLSFILLIAVAVAGIAAYTVMKRRIRNR